MSYQEAIVDTYTLPEWIRVEAVRNNNTHDMGLRIGLRARDGDVSLFAQYAGFDVLRSPGRSDRVNLTQRQLLEHVVEVTTKQLAILALEGK